MCKKIFLTDVFSRVWDKKDPFAEAFGIAGEDYRKVKARRTSRFELEGKGYFINPSECSDPLSAYPFKSYLY